MTDRVPEDYVALLYRHLLQRPADPDGLRHFAERLRGGTRLEILIDAILDSDEYRRKTLPDPPLHPFEEEQTEPLVIVDLGAQSLSDEPHIYAPLIEAGLDWRCVGFEPQKDRLAERVAAEGDHRLTMIDAFVGDGERRTFHLNSDSGSSSLLRLNTAFNRSFDHIAGIHTVGQEAVQTSRLDDVLDLDSIDFLKLDIQGYELHALAGAKRTLERTNVVHCEVFFGPMYEDTAYFSEIELFLRARGFGFVDFSHLNRYEYVDVPESTGKRDRLIWGDAVFFRQLRPGTDRPHCFLAQAAIASLVYGKNGFAQKILSEREKA